jgi:MATE family multidrug resistance protein
VLASQALGRGDWGEALRIGWTALALDVAAMAVAGLACVAFDAPVARLLTSDAGLGASLAGVMGLVALLMIPDGGQGVADALLRTHGFNWFPTVARAAAFVLVAPPLGFYLGDRLGLGAAGVIAATLIASTAAFAALLWRYAAASRSGPDAGSTATRRWTRQSPSAATR